MVRSWRHVYLTLWALLVWSMPWQVAFAAALECSKLAEGTPYETSCYVQRADEPGPTVLIVGGVHGNEPAGAHAVDVVRYWPIERGTVISVPRANVRSLTAGVRRIPDEEVKLDLNRLFPKPDAELPDPPEHPLAQALWQLLKTHKPQWVFDCHEGGDFHKVNSKSVGSSVIADKKPETQAMAEAMLAAVNVAIEPAEKQFVLLGPPIAGSLARAASQHVGAKAMILETTSKDQRIPVRARQHRLMLHAALAKLRMLTSAIVPETLHTKLCDEQAIHVGIFDDVGVGGAGRLRVEDQLASRPGFRTVRFDGHDMRAGACEEFDVLVFSGGTGSGQSNSLGEDGKRRVQEFVKNGGMYLGICAGAYLAGSSSPSYGLGLLNVQTKSPLWRRGTADLSVEITPDGRDVFAIEGDSKRLIRYVNGPVWKAAGRDDLPEPTILAWYRTEVAKNGTPEGAMVDSPALIRGQYGSGIAYAFSCHPEQTAGCEDFVFHAIAAERSLETVNSGQSKQEPALAR